MENSKLPTEIAAALSQLDEELAEGDITTKGYLKRRTQLFASTGLSTYLDYSRTFTDETTGDLTREQAAVRSSFNHHSPSASTSSIASKERPAASLNAPDETYVLDHSDEGRTSTFNHKSFYIEGNESISNAQQLAMEREIEESDGFYDARYAPTQPPTRFEPHMTTSLGVLQDDISPPDLREKHREEFQDRPSSSPALNLVHEASRVDRHLQDSRRIDDSASAWSSRDSQLRPLEPRGLPFAIHDPRMYFCSCSYRQVGRLLMSQTT